MLRKAVLEIYLGCLKIKARASFELSRIFSLVGADGLRVCRASAKP